jgi:hypothetical protein
MKFGKENKEVARSQYDHSYCSKIPLAIVLDVIIQLVLIKGKKLANKKFSILILIEN